jgi:3-oxoacyl-[acyl-carrier protein] reductase
MSELNGKVALVTGASRGTGRAIATALAQAGCDGALNYRLSSKEAEAVRVDEVEELFTAVERDLKPIDGRVNNAG